MAYYFYPQGQNLKPVATTPPIQSAKSPFISNQKCNDVSKIIQPIGDQGGLFIGNISCSQNPMLLKMNKIGTVVTIDNSNTIRFDKNTIKQHFIMPISESSSNDSLFKYMDQTLDFICSSMKKTNVIIHCHSGLRLSSAVAIAHLIKNNDLTAEKAFAHIKKCRSVAKIDNGLFLKLKQYESQCKVPKKTYNLPKASELAESTFTDDSDQSVHPYLPFDPQVNKIMFNPKSKGIQLTQSYEGYF